MPYILDDLVINRVDLVDEGCCSAAFIELYKRKEQSEKMDVKEILAKMKPEHASVIEEAINKAKEELSAAITERDEARADLEKAKEDLTAANEDLEKAKSELETLQAEKEDDEEEPEETDKAKTGASFDEAEVLKGMPEAAREVFEKMKQQKEIAEEELRKAKEAEEESSAIAKAKELKAIPVEQSKLVSIIKRADNDVLDLLTTVNAAIEGTVLDEVGKSNPVTKTGTSGDAWAKIESAADEIAKRDNITKAKAISVVIKEKPELYKEYLQGGAN